MSNQNNAGRAADPVVQAIEDRIHAGILMDGHPLPPERDLMEEFGVSRTVAREAVRLLSSRGLVEARPRFRPVVRKPGFDTAVDVVGGIVTHLLCQPDGVKNLFDSRAMIEISLARQAATGASKGDIAALKGALENNGLAIEDSDLFYQTDKAFHEVLYQIPQNPVLPAIHKAYSTWLAPQWSRMPRLSKRNQENFQAHTAIFEAILMRDPDAAEAAMKSHLDAAWKQVRETFGDI
ncbi:FadR/GntR family transcriptional regulator [Falsihalocynthiibacter sp. CO-5D18]|uniref:FadR/GntR family transcriptional regulator n=1 Tax=Falsihalocynthiibacter sp. CO-5D18 TaxID=3240872 RepID=UPI0035100102